MAGTPRQPRRSAGARGLLTGAALAALAALATALSLAAGGPRALGAQAFPPAPVPPALPPGLPMPGIPPVAGPAAVPPMMPPVPPVPGAASGPLSGVVPASIGAPAPVSPFAVHRPPVIGLVQPGPGGAVPADRPVVGLRFAPGEPHDPVDPNSFTLTVDGRDRTSSFQVAAPAASAFGGALGAPVASPTVPAVGEAWGALVDAAGGGRAALAAGPHRVRARVCSVRGVCAALEATVTAVADPVAGAPAAAGPSRSRRVLGALLDAGRRLVAP